MFRIKLLKFLYDKKCLLSERFVGGRKKETNVCTLSCVVLTSAKSKWYSLLLMNMSRYLTHFKIPKEL